jgi:hypothetical protein
MLTWSLRAEGSFDHDVSHTVKQFISHHANENVSGKTGFVEP